MNTGLWNMGSGFRPAAARNDKKFCDANLTAANANIIKNGMRYRFRPKQKNPNSLLTSLLLHKYSLLPNKQFPARTPCSSA
jgi:hypothetical protein